MRQPFTQNIKNYKVYHFQAFAREASVVYTCDMSFTEEKAAIALLRISGVGADMFRRLLIAYGSPSAAHAAVLTGTARSDGFDVPRTTMKRSVPGLVERTCDKLDKFGTGEGMFWYGGSGYPARLLNVPEPPPVLFWQGIHDAAKIWNTPVVAIVGARKASPAGVNFADKLSRSCVESGWTVVSGGAAGIDAAAHNGALETDGGSAGGVTVAVVATGLDIWYPKSNHALFQRILAHGLMMSEFFPGTPPVRSHFPTRNRIIAALADAVVFVEGGERSGALITVRKAIDVQRPVFSFLAEGIDQGGLSRIVADDLRVTTVTSCEQLMLCLKNIL
ncbi:MAG: DNA-protecting protein DprA [Candidatus Riflebacteria bacterium]|nr:DNA-protecting protein DprA [Candidatus Riflebacteria bacterium]